MATVEYGYSAAPTRNPLRYARALWRLVTRDLETTTDEAAIVELGFARSKLGRRFARWDEVASALHRDPRTLAAIQDRRPVGPIVLEDLEKLPEGTLGRSFAAHCRARALNPNLVQIPPTDEVGWILHHLYQTHDIWHVVTGWGNDLPGEVGLGGFYAAQLKNPAFFGYLYALILLNVVWRRGDLGQVLEAFNLGYRTGKQSQPLFGTDWNEFWSVALGDVRKHFAIPDERLIGEGIRTAA